MKVIGLLRLGRITGEKTTISPTTLSRCKPPDFDISGTLRRCRRTVDVAPVPPGDNRLCEPDCSEE